LRETRAQKESVFRVATGPGKPGSQGILSVWKSQGKLRKNSKSEGKTNEKLALFPFFFQMF